MTQSTQFSFHTSNPSTYALTPFSLVQQKETRRYHKINHAASSDNACDFIQDVPCLNLSLDNDYG
jgi:hypothetical protein